jgi:hypothetical protein
VTFRHIVQEDSEEPDIDVDSARKEAFGTGADSDQTLFEDSSENSNIENNFLDQILHKGAEDSPDVFKRVRLFTRWQDSPESRGSKITAFGNGTSFWDVTKSMHDMIYEFDGALLDHLTNYLDNTRSRDAWEDVLFVWTGFIGRTLKQSYPIVLIYTKKKRVRSSAVSALQRSSWARKNGLLVASCSGPRWKGYFLNWAAEYEPHNVGWWSEDL